MFPALLMSGLLLLAALPVYAEGDADAGKEEASSGVSADIVDNAGDQGERVLPDPGKILSESRNGEADRRGRISIRLTDGAPGTSKQGVWMSCTKVADITDGRYCLRPACKDDRIDLNAIENAASLERAAGILSEKSTAPDCTVQTDEDGRAETDNLETGVYLIQALDNSGYDEITPALVSVPSWDEKTGTMVYEVTVSPKHTPETEERGTGKTAPQTGVFSPVLMLFGSSAVLLGAAAALNLPGGRKETDEEN